MGKEPAKRGGQAGSAGVQKSDTGSASIVRGTKRDIDSGLSSQQQKRLKGIEANLRKRDVEGIAIVGKDGKILGVNTKGIDNAVEVKTNKYATKAALKDAWMTHNHPGARLGDNIAGRIGSSLSGADLRVAANFDTKGIRAVTKNGYTYSVERPKGGWPSGARMANMWSSVRDFEHTVLRETLRDKIQSLPHKQQEEQLNRIAIVANERAMRAVAKAYGVKYTRRRTK